MHPGNETASVFSIALSIFVVFNALSFMPLMMALLAHYDAARQKKIIVRECLIALGILLLFTFFGTKVLEVIGIPHPIMNVAGGVLLFLISYPKNNRRNTQKPFKNIFCSFRVNSDHSGRIR